MEPEPQVGERPALGKVGGALSVASGLLVVAVARWAHHWGLLAEGVVSAWAVVTIGALVISIWSLCTSRVARRFAKIGIAITVVSILALAVVGLALAAGAHPGGGCGGG